MEYAKAVNLVRCYTNDITEFPDATRTMRIALAQLLEGFMPDDEYAAEKLIKSFAEHIYALNATLHRQETDRIGADYRKGNLTSHQLENWRVVMPQIEERLRAEVSRQLRHYSVFLLAAQSAHLTTV